MFCKSVDNAHTSRGSSGNMATARNLKLHVVCVLGILPHILGLAIYVNIKTATNRISCKAYSVDVSWVLFFRLGRSWSPRNASDAELVPIVVESASKLPLSPPSWS